MTFLSPQGIRHQQCSNQFVELKQIRWGLGLFHNWTDSFRRLLRPLLALGSALRLLLLLFSFHGLLDIFALVARCASRTGTLLQLARARLLPLFAGTPLFLGGLAGAAGPLGELGGCRHFLLLDRCARPSLLFGLFGLLLLLSAGHYINYSLMAGAR
jgi:hypothetical protein